MSGKKDAAQIFARLKRAAAAGDPHARALLAKFNRSLEASILSSVDEAVSVADAVHGAQEEEEEAIGVDFAHGALYGAGLPEGGSGDALEDADRVMRALPPGSDGLDVKAAVVQGKWGTLKSVAPWVRINPPSVLQGTLGGQQDVKIGDRPFQVINFAAENEETLPLTVTLAPVLDRLDPAFFLTYGSFRPIGIVRFGTRAFMRTITVDILQGVQFTVSGATLVAQVGFDDTAVASGLGRDVLPLGGMLSFYPIEKNIRLTRTLYNDGVADIPGTKIASFLVPPFARNVIVWRAPRADAMQVLFNDVNSTTHYVTTVAGGADMPVPIDLAGDIFQIQVQDTSGGAGQFFSDIRVIFGLST